MRVEDLANLAPDSDVRQAALEVERHVAAEGWDQAPRLFALVRTAALVAQQPELAGQLGDAVYTPVEQEGLPDQGSLEESLDAIAWPPAVDGCAVVVERIMLPPEAEQDVPDDPAALEAYVAAHPDRRDVRIVAAVTRDGQSHTGVRGRPPADDELLEAPDLVPNLTRALRDTLAD